MSAPQRARTIASIYLDVAAAAGDGDWKSAELSAAIAQLVPTIRSIEDGETSMTSPAWPAVYMMSKAIDYAADRLGVDRDAVIFDLRMELFGDDQ